MNADLKDMIKISRAVGTDPRLVQGGGGNTSVKTAGGGRMYIKASGTALGEMVEGNGYREVDTDACVNIVADDAIAGMCPHERESVVLQKLLDYCVDDLPGRPSVETSLHAMLSRCVVHTHPSPINGFLCAYDGESAIAEVLDDIPYLYIEFCGAGFPLALRMKHEIEQFKTEHGSMPQVILLGNHGLFVTADDADEALAITSDVFGRLDAAGRAAIENAQFPAFPSRAPAETDRLVESVMAPVRKFFAEVFGRPSVVRFDDTSIIREFLTNPDREELVKTKPLTPDQVVYCKASPVYLKLPEDATAVQSTVREALDARFDGQDNTPTCVLVEGLGLFSAAPTFKLLEAVFATMQAALETLNIASQFGGARPLTDEMIIWMGEWEVERFRHQLVATGGADDDLAGHVALVTGAGSGIGRGISLALASKGLHVILADIDLAAAQETVEMATGAAGGLLAVRIDVTNENAVASAFSEAVRSLGGVDMLVNCAGIAPAGPLVEMDVAKWRLALEINLTGYMLSAREAARIMIRQGTGGNIINISSKTGLDASRNNSAYNATKAGELHLARGWALELAENGIRVNSICPGNIFEGSKIWNDDYVKVVAEKRGIEPDEVIPYYTSLTALKQEIRWEDIGEAVAFLCSPRASKITGQSLVVDAGQVFVR